MTQPTPTDSGEERRLREVAFRIAQSLYGYFEGGSAGSAEAMTYFENYRNTAANIALVERVLGYLRPLATPPQPSADEKDDHAHGTTPEIAAIIDETKRLVVKPVGCDPHPHSLILSLATQVHLARKALERGTLSNPSADEKQGTRNWMARAVVAEQIVSGHEIALKACDAVISKLKEDLRAATARAEAAESELATLNARCEGLEKERGAKDRLWAGLMLKSDMFDYLCWLEDFCEFRKAALDGKAGDYLLHASDGTTCWGKTYAEAVRVAMEHDKELQDRTSAIDAARQSAGSGEGKV